MPSWIHRQRLSTASDPVEQFHRDVMACTRVLGRELPALGKRYSVQVFTVSLALHLKATFALCLREGHLTESQVDLLIGPLFQSDSERQPAEFSESARPASDQSQD
jgi:hypothetical protein